MGKTTTPKGFITEADIQIAIVQIFSQFAARHPGFLFFSVPNEAVGAGRDRKKAAIRMIKLKTMGLLPGVSDLVVVYRGAVYFLEIKRPGESLSKNQQLFANKVRLAGAVFIMLSDADQAIRFLAHIQSTHILPD